MDIKLEPLDHIMVNDLEDVRVRKPLKARGLALLALSFSTLGVIYSDIGTSPLYVLNGIWPAAGDAPSPEDVIGGISAIIWSLTLVPLVKYVGFALQFGSVQGEGGSFALFMTLFPRPQAGDGRSLTTYPTQRSMDHPIYNSLLRFRWPLLVWTLFGTSLTLADGILTPAVSVTSAVGGIAVAKPSVLNAVVGVSIAFLVLLFVIQPMGTHRLSIAFAPITAIWLALLGGTGIYNITSYPGIWRAYDPSRAILWFVRTKNYDYLAGVLLAITGCEAMFANLGQFNRASIRIAFSCYVYPMLILAYLGQGAKLITDPSVIQSVFYRTIPGETGGALYWIVFIFAILATLIASQAMITATFSLVHQLMGMQCFPTLRIKHTSILTAGQIYIGPINWLLLIGTVAVVGGFGSSSALTLAYGFAVATVLFVTSTMIALSMPLVKHLPWICGVVFLLFFGFIDGLFWGASLKKVPHGAWFPLGLGCILTICMTFWSWARALEERFDDSHTKRLTEVVAGISEEADEDEDGGSRPGVGGDADAVESVRGSTTATPVRHSEDRSVALLRPGASNVALPRLPVLAIFHRSTPSGQGVPHTFSQFLSGYPAIPKLVIFLSITTMAIPHVPDTDRYAITRVRSLAGFWAVTMRNGYLDVATPSVGVIMSRIDPHRALDRPDITTHIIPSYSFRAAVTGVRGWDWVRRFFIEELYVRTRVMFPDADNVANVDEQVIRVAVPAAI